MNTKTHLLVLSLLLLAIAALGGCIRGVTGDTKCLQTIRT